MKKRFLALFLVIAMCAVFPLTALADASATAAPAPAVTPGAPVAGNFNIGVIQLLQHPALDAAFQGFVDQLAAEGYIQGTNLTIDFQNAQGDQSNCSTIANKFNNENLDLILAIATPAAQAVANVITDKPVLFTAITDPVAAGLIKSLDAPGTNLTGTSDLTPVADQLKMLQQVIPGVKNVGVFYTSSEPNSVIQANIAKTEGAKLGLTMTDFTISSSNEITQVLQSMVGKVDAIYIPTDNTLAAAMATVALVTEPNKIPVMAGEAGMVQGGATMTLGIDYYNLGMQTGAMAAQILSGQAQPQTMPVQFQTNFSYTVNMANAAAIGLTFPQEILDRATQINGN